MRRSIRRSVTTTTVKTGGAEADAVAAHAVDVQIAPPPRRTRRKRDAGQATVLPASGEVPDGNAIETPRRGRERKDPVQPPGEDTAMLPPTPAADGGGRAKRAPVERASIPRSLTPRLPNPEDERFCKVISWNVAGLRGLLKREAAVAAIAALMERERPDVLCLQETKLQEHHVEEVEPRLLSLLPGYRVARWSCSTARKGYAGTAILVRDDSHLQVQGDPQCGIGEAIGDAEGRVLSADLGPFVLVVVYTPNAGDGLKRLQFRTETWDTAFARYVVQLRAKGRPVVVAGDLNCAHHDTDFFNPHEPRTKKAACTTPEERASFSRLLETTGMIDCFRVRHPEAKGVYSYFSIRANNRPYNRGLRLDYILATPDLTSEGPVRLYDSYILDEEPSLLGVSDHCPVGVTLVLGG